MTQDKKVNFLLNYCHISPSGLLTCLALAFGSLSWSQKSTLCLPAPPVTTLTPGLEISRSLDFQ